MLRSILAVIASYVALFIILFCVLTGAYLAMGADRAFQPGSFHPSTLWLVVEIVFGFLAAALAGLLCIAIAKKRGAVLALVIVILVIGLASAIPAMKAAQRPEATREGGLSNLQAMMQARPPVWMAFFNPFLGAAGVLVGSRFKKVSQ